MLYMISSNSNEAQAEKNESGYQKAYILIIVLLTP